MVFVLCGEKSHNLHSSRGYPEEQSHVCRIFFLAHYIAKKSAAKIKNQKVIDTNKYISHFGKYLKIPRSKTLGVVAP